MDASCRRAAGAPWLLGFRGETAPDAFLRVLDRFHPRGLILFRDNLPQGAATLALLRPRLEEAADGPLALFLDEEGGWIQQLSAPIHPSPRAQAMAGPEAVTACHRSLARRLRALGVDAVCAPLADLDDGARNPVIGTRSFGPDPVDCAAAVSAALAGLAAEGLRGVLKHFPGHGDSSEDSHHCLPEIPSDRRAALIPFRAGVAAGAPAIMSAHLRLADDEDSRPATFRPDIMGRWLRDELGFEGLVITDALEMAGAAVIPAEDRAAAALAAGNHLLTLGRWEPGAELLLDAAAADLARGRIPQAHLDKAAERWTAFMARETASSSGESAVLSLFDPGASALFRPGGGENPPAPAPAALDLEFGPLGSWSRDDFTRLLDPVLGGTPWRRLKEGESLAAPVYLYLGRLPPASARLRELELLAERGAAPLVVCNGPWAWTLPFPLRLATAESSPAGLPALLCRVLSTSRLGG